MKKKGVYFISNDYVLELTIAFLNSFRKHNPDVALCLIPFNDSISRLSQLQNKYRFSIYPNNDLLKYYDHLSLNFHSEARGHYRKLALWEGIFDEFIYIDIDTIVLANFNFVFTLLDQFDILTAYSNVKGIQKWVWKDSVYNTAILNTEQIAFAANTGFIASKKGIITVEDAKSKLSTALKLKPHMALECQEQPFLNYMIVTSNKRHNSLYQLLDTDLLKENVVECWAGKKHIKKDGKFQIIENGKLRQIFFIHWAGVWQPKKLDKRLFALLKLIGYRKHIWTISKFMPHKKLWKYYRNLNPE